MDKTIFPHIYQALLDAGYKEEEISEILKNPFSELNIKKLIQAGVIGESIKPENYKIINFEHKIQQSKLLNQIYERENTDYGNFASSPLSRPDYSSRFESSGSGGGSGCFIATAAYGTCFSDEINTLCKFRDKFLLKNSFGYKFVEIYYNISPPIASFISTRELLKILTRTILIPLLWLIRIFMSVHEKIKLYA